MTGQNVRIAFVAAWLLIGMHPPRLATAQDDADPPPKAKSKAQAKSKTSKGAAVAKAEASPARAPAYAMVPTSSKRIKATLGFEVKAPRILAEEWTAYAALPPKLPGQSEVRATLTPRGVADRDSSPAARPILVGKLAVRDESARHDLTARVDYQMVLHGRKLEKREPDAPPVPAVPALDARTRRAELESTRAFDHRSESFRSWLVARELKRDADEDEVDFARRAFVAVRKAIKHHEGEDVTHVASEVARAGKSDFGGITAVYVAALRANGIPARALGGFPVVFEGRPNKNFWPHAKVEFYAQGVGWVPADIAGAVRFNRTDDGLDCFGVDPADFLATHVDNDMVIETTAGPKTIEWLPDVAWWVDGSGSFGGLKIKQTLTVQVEPIPQAETTAR